jgi:hypothetical protein
MTLSQKAGLPLVVLFLGAAACESRAPAPASGFPLPSGYMAVSLAIDDSVDRVYLGGQLKWKGAMSYDPVTRIALYDSGWSGPFAPLYDDGPWQDGGHEGTGATAGDHVFGATVFMKAPASLTEAASSPEVQYGLIDEKYQRLYGNGWLWPLPANGSFRLPYGLPDLLLAKVALRPFGDVDLRLTLDTTLLAARVAPLPAWDTTTVSVKGSAWCWAPVAATAAGGGIYTVVMSDWVGSHMLFDHTLLLGSGDRPEFVWVLGAEEYKVGGDALLGGVRAELKPRGGSWTAQPVLLQDLPDQSGDRNTYLIVP